MGMIQCRSLAGWMKDCFLAQDSNVWPTAQGRILPIIHVISALASRHQS